MVSALAPACVAAPACRASSPRRDRPRYRRSDLRFSESSHLHFLVTQIGTIFREGVNQVAKRSSSFDLEQAIAAIAAELDIPPQQVRAAVELLEAGNTIPFIARYRKEATRGLDELQLRRIEDAFEYARDLADRKATILASIKQQGLLTESLREQIEACREKQVLEDLYLPFKPKRRTRATIARERGLEPLAEILLAQRRLSQSRDAILQRFIAPDREVPDGDAALQGACDIVAEQWAEDPETRLWVLGQARRGRIESKARRGKQDPQSKFAMYFDHAEAAQRIPSHRLLAIRRGEAEGVLRVGIAVDDQFAIGRLRQRLVREPRFEFRQELERTVDDCYHRLLLPAAESTVMQELTERAEDEAIGVFAKNLRELLLAAPAGQRVTMGIDPGFRTGCKVAVVDETGKFLASETIYPTPPREDIEGATKTLRRLIEQYDVQLIAIGNGTASRETDRFVSTMLRDAGLQLTHVLVSESGASIYSASDVAVAEYPDLDVTVRGAISIAHRLQDPLAELVKLDPKSIGVGQYQHDVNQTKLRKSLDREVESCVNSVGVDLNTASAPLLSYVGGIGAKLASGIVAVRDARGRFERREQLLEVPKLGRKAYEQAAGFLRIRDGAQPLDNSAVHPESYYVVEKMADQLGVATAALVGNATQVAKLDPAAFIDDRVGLPTVQDILTELAKPGRDPRREFKAVRFAEGVDALEDLKPGMVLQGVVTNVTRFGAFVDVGVHQDGLVHISELDHQYVQDPSDAVSVGDMVRVKVLEVDVPRRRISLSRKQA